MITNETTQETDTPWKDIIETLFQQFMEFFFPDAHAGIDWSRKPVFLDKELQQVMRGAATGRRYVDQLVKVWRVGGEETWVLIHIEVQGQRDRAFPRRMFVYHNRLFDHYGCLVGSFVVLADDYSNWRPQEYRHSLWGVEVGLRFRTAKLLDYRESWAELERNRNPFAVVAMAHLQAQANKRNENERLRWRLILAKMLYKRGYTREEVLALFRFMEYVLALPEALEIEYERQMEVFEEGQKVTYLSRFEKRGMRQGLQQGLKEGAQKGAATLILRLLRQRLGGVDTRARARILTLPIERLEELGVAVLDFSAPKDLAAWLNKHASP